ncbi:UNVERIFIED_CONTAM: hypothetical protein PYX00_010880 [Menopon gallinae]|uniref:Uncharacterized protein n=1 Tax=Menopon gallinae TaxID=328185 RepID=A0AAW2H6D0_9NEOP
MCSDADHMAASTPILTPAPPHIMAQAASEYSPVYLKDLCILHKVNDALEKITDSFLQFKREHIDCLEFVDTQMLKTYEFAFFCCFFGLKAGAFLKIHKFNRSVFLRTMGEKDVGRPRAAKRVYRMPVMQRPRRAFAGVAR